MLNGSHCPPQLFDTQKCVLFYERFLLSAGRAKDQVEIERKLFSYGITLVWCCFSNLETVTKSRCFAFRCFFYIHIKRDTFHKRLQVGCATRNFHTNTHKTNNEINKMFCKWLAFRWITIANCDDNVVGKTMRLPLNLLQKSWNTTKHIEHSNEQTSKILWQSETNIVSAQATFHH